MKTKAFFLSIIYFFNAFFLFQCYAQNVGINTAGLSPNTAALLDIDANPNFNKGLLIPRVTFSQRTGSNFNPLSVAAQGLTVYQTDAGGFGEGFYYNTSSTTSPAWMFLLNNSSGWSLTGNAASNPSSSPIGTAIPTGQNYVGTIDLKDFVMATNNLERLRISSAGNVGIGTTTPGTLLDVNGSTKALLYTFPALVGDPAPVITARTVPAGQGSSSEKTELILFHSNDPATAAGADQITLRAPALSFQTFSDVNVLDINNSAGYNERMYINSIGNVGIGTTTPGFKLHVPSGYIGTDYINTSDNGVSSGVTGIMVKQGDNYYRTSNAAGVLTFLGITALSGTGTTNYLARWTSSTALGIGATFDNGTNVGIGTAAPGGKLDVNGTIVISNSGSTTLQSGESGLWMHAGTGNLYLADSRDWDRYLGLTYTPGATAAQSGVFTIGQINKNAATFTHGVTNFYTNGVERVRINNAGNVGIGTTTPTAKLHVAGGGQIIGTNGTTSNTRTLTILNDGQAQVNFGSYPGAWTPAIQIQNNDNTRYLWMSPLDNASGANAKILANGTGLDFFTGTNANAVTITSAGNVGIGTTTPGFKLHVPSGYIGTDYINTSDNAVSSGVTGIMVKQGDNYYRTSNAAGVLTFLGITAPNGDNLGNHTATTTLNLNANNISNGGSINGTIFYDQNNTGYYIDPASTSQLYAVTNYTRAAFNLARLYTNRRDITADQNYWTGTNGWGTSEATWDNAWKFGYSGLDIWGTSSGHPQGAGYVHAQGIQSGMHYATADGVTAYGWQMVGAANATENRYWLRGKWDIATSGWVEMITTGNIGSQGFIPNNGSGNWQIASNSNATDYSTSSLELRETNFAGAGQQPPRLGFHWSGVVASQISIENSGRMAIRNNPGTGYENFIAKDIYADGGGWFRAVGNQGYYFETYGGGWFMQDATWIRGYNGKSLWMAGGLIGGDGGLTIGYGGASPAGGGAIIAGKVGIGTSGPAASAALDVTSTSQGFLPPRMTNTQRNAIASPVAGLVIYNTTTNCLEFYNGTAWVATCGAAPCSAGTQTFNYSGSITNFTVPSGCSTITIEVSGAEGGSGQGGGGGLGARMKGTFTLTPGQVLKILVGGAGGAGTQGGGGGGSFVTDASNNPLVIAGGGGGANYSSYDYGTKPGTTSASGQNGYCGGGCPGSIAGTGGSGGSGGGACQIYGSSGAGGGGLTGNGVACSPTCGGNSFTSGGAGGCGCGSSGSGGFGGGGGGEWCSWTGGGGGGGYSGGGGGTYYGNGGGGGSYNGGASPSNSSGVQTGNGVIKISW